MRKAIPFLLLGSFFALLVPRMLRSMAQGAAYPEWSTLRSDPLGAKVLFLALQQAGAAPVERGYEPWREARPRRVQTVWLGVSPLLLQDAAGLDRLLSAGGMALAALRPAGKFAPRTERLGFVQASGAALALKSAEWRCLIGEPDRCRLAEKALGRGRLWVLADGSPLRNGALHTARDTDLLARLFSHGMPVVFDESHLGVTETGGVGVLLRRYRLFPALGLALFATLLFVWRGSVSLLPASEPAPARMAPQPAASLRTLLEQRIPRSKLLATLAGEWKRALPLLPAWHRGRAADVVAALEYARALKDVRQGYAALRAAVRVRKETA